jgi:hypothetical protein
MSTPSTSYHCRAIDAPISALVVGGDELDLDIAELALHVLDGHPRGRDRPFAAEIRIGAGLVIEHADLDAERRLSGDSGGEYGRDTRGHELQSHANHRFTPYVCSDCWFCLSGGEGESTPPEPRFSASSE